MGEGGQRAWRIGDRKQESWVWYEKWEVLTPLSSHFKHFGF